MRNALIACIALGLVACVNPYAQTGNNPTRTTVKVVDAKQPPGTLIAVDRSICLVTADRYRNTNIGDAVYCNWRGGEMPAGIRAEGDDWPKGIPRVGRVVPDMDAPRPGNPRSQAPVGSGGATSRD